jgi:aryl carrier-like protein
MRQAINRHPALRSRFRLDLDDRKVKYRTDGEPVDVGVIDAAADGWSAEELRQLVDVLCYTPFDLAAEPPVRAEVIKVDADTTLLVLSAHHIVFDGMSRQLLLDQAATIYRALLAGTEPDLPAPVHPADVAGDLSAEELAEQVTEVVERLRGAPTDVELPYDNDPLSADVSMSGAAATITLDTEVTAKVLATANQEGATAFMAGVALLAGTLARRGRQRDFLFSVVWPGRDDPATADAVGMFMNTVVVRTGLDESTSWRELLRRTRNAGRATFIDSNVPLDAVAAALDPGRDPDRPPLTPVLVNLAESPAPVRLTQDVVGHYEPLDPFYCKWNLALFIGLDHESDGVRLEFALHYPVALFEDTTIARLLAALRDSAVDLATHPEELVHTPEPDHGDLSDPTVRLELVRSIWREVLGAEQVGDDISFFDAGGDSLRLVILVERLNQVSGRTLATMDLFRAGTVRGQADMLTGETTSPTGADARPTSRDRLLGAARARVAGRGTR